MLKYSTKLHFFCKNVLTLCKERCIMLTSQKNTGQIPKKEENKMKKILALLLAVALLCCSVFALGSCTPEENLAAAYDKIVAELEFDDSNLPELTVAMSPDFAPMEFVDLAKSGDDQYVGFDVILAKYIAKELNMKLVIKPMSFDACTAALDTDKADLAISGFSWTAERAEYYAISDYYIAGENENEQILITKAGTTINADTDFTGMVIGAQGASLQKILVEEQLVTKGAELKQYESINDAFAALEGGQIDALAVAYGNGEALAASSEGSVVLSDFYFQVDELYKNNVILLNKADTELLTKVNAALAKALNANLYDQWYEACQIYAAVKTADELGYDDEGNKITE